MSDLHLQGRLKGYLGGVEYYRPFVRTGLHSRPLRRTFRTADGAMRYGQKVVENYKRWSPAQPEISQKPGCPPPKKVPCYAL